MSCHTCLGAALLYEGSSWGHRNELPTGKMEAVSTLVSKGCTIFIDIVG